MKLEDKRNFIIYTDGAARGNPGPAGAGGLITLPGEERIFAKISEYLGVQTNNAAEYLALLITLSHLPNGRLTGLTVYADSQLMVRQLKGEYRVKNSGLKPLFRLAKRRLNQVDNLRLTHIRRERNKVADQLANEAVDAYLEGEKEPFKISRLLMEIET